MKEESKASAAEQTREESEVEELEGTAGNPLQEAIPTDTSEEHAEQIAELERRILRLHADFDNYRKRTLRDRQEYALQAEAALLQTMLPVLDNFDRALEALPENQPWAEGVKLVHRQWMDVLSNQGLSAIDCSQPFDPNFHEAVMRDDNSDAEEGTILQELQRGYLYKGRLLRPSMVKVAGGAGADRLTP